VIIAHLTIALKCAAALLAGMVAYRRHDHWPVALFLMGTTAADLPHMAIVAWVLQPAREAIRAAGADPALVPFAGWTRVLGHIDVALFLTWPAGIAALALVLFTKRRPWPAAMAWAAVSIALALGYPAIRHDLLRRCYTAIELASLAVVAASVLTWGRRDRELPSFPQTVALLIFVAEFGSLFVGAWRWGLFLDAWFFSQVAYATLYAVLIVVQGGALWNIKLPSRSS
jgi:hypothetical protein